MTTLREVAAGALCHFAEDKRNWCVSGTDHTGDADAVLSAIFNPENREALREELVERGVVAPTPRCECGWVSGNHYHALRMGQIEFRRSAGSGGAG